MIGKDNIDDKVNSFVMNKKTITSLKELNELLQTINKTQYHKAISLAIDTNIITSSEQLEKILPNFRRDSTVLEAAMAKKIIKNSKQLMTLLRDCTVRNISTARLAIKIGVIKSADEIKQLQFAYRDVPEAMTNINNAHRLILEPESHIFITTETFDNISKENDIIFDYVNNLKQYGIFFDNMRDQDFKSGDFKIKCHQNKLQLGEIKFLFKKYQDIINLKNAFHEIEEKEQLIQIPEEGYEAYNELKKDEFTQDDIEHLEKSDIFLYKLQESDFKNLDFIKKCEASDMPFWQIKFLFEKYENSRDLKNMVGLYEPETQEINKKKCDKKTIM